MTLSLALDPRFPGGTSGAIAREIPELMEIGSVSLAALSSRMLRPFPVNPALETAIADQGLTLNWNPPVVAADIIVLHNPSFLKFDEKVKSRLVCDQLIVVTHENFTGPDGAEAFDISHCLSLIDDAVLCRAKHLAPVSDYNRDVTKAWLKEASLEDWQVLDRPWHNICAFDLASPTATPRDRRGRHSRAGFEKFPDARCMRLLFPDHADYCGILGGDSFMNDLDRPAHWQLYGFREIPVAQFLDQIDFFVYFTNERWRESFGRVIAEAIAAGKLVLTDPQTASTFGPGVIGTTPKDVDMHIAKFVGDPSAYQAQVLRAQKDLSAFSRDAFAQNVRQFIENSGISS